MVTFRCDQNRRTKSGFMTTPAEQTTLQLDGLRKKSPISKVRHESGDTTTDFQQ